MLRPSRLRTTAHSARGRPGPGGGARCTTRRSSGTTHIAAGSRPDRLSAVSGQQERDLRDTVEQLAAEQVVEVPKISLQDGVPWRAVLREPQVVEQLVDVPVPSFCEFELVSEEAEEDYEGEEEEELEMFDETTNRLELQLAPPAPMPPLHGGPLRRRVGLHVRARRTRAPPVYPSCSRTWTCQCRRSRLSSRRRSWSSWWMCQRHRSWESWQLCRPHHRGACRRKFFR